MRASEALRLGSLTVIPERKTLLRYRSTVFDPLGVTKVYGCGLGMMMEAIGRGGVCGFSDPQLATSIAMQFATQQWPWLNKMVYCFELPLNFFPEQSLIMIQMLVVAWIPTLFDFGVPVEKIAAWLDSIDPTVEEEKIDEQNMCESNVRDGRGAAVYCPVNQ